MSASFESSGCDDKYLYFSDNSIKDRLAFLAPMHSTNKKVSLPGRDLEPSQRCLGWDKYFFFSSTDGHVNNTARRGRNRPAMGGPQTFMTEPFTPEVIARERGRIEALGPRTVYTESFGAKVAATQPRPSAPAEAPGERRPPRTPMARVASDSVLARPPGSRPSPEEPAAGVPHVMAADELARAINPHGDQTISRHGPHWPPPGRERPDSLKTRRRLAAQPLPRHSPHYLPTTA